MLNFLFTQTPLAFLVQSFWRDEAFSYILARKSVFEIISLSTKDFNPPLYYLLLHYWLKILGSAEISLRVFSLVFFWATLFVVYLFFEKVLKLGSKKSLIYLLLFLLNPFLSYFAFEARNYSLLAFFATLSYYTFYKKRYRLYFFATVLGLYTHYFMLFVPLSQLLFIFLSEKKRLRFKLSKKLILPPLIVFLPWFIFVLTSKSFFTSPFWIGRVSLRSILYLFGIIYTGYDSGLTFYSRRIALISLGILFLIYWIIKKVGWTKLKTNHLFLLFGLWGVGVPFFIILISFIKPMFLSRYFIFSTVGFLLLIVYLLELLRPKQISLILIILLIIAIDFQRLQIQFRKKRDFKRVTSEIKALVKRGDLIYVTSELDFFTAKYYYPKGKIYIFNKSYQEIPDFVGKVLISRSDISYKLPIYPNKAFILNPDGTYTIQALF